MFVWKKMGKVFDPTHIKERAPWQWEFAQGINTLTYDTFVRVYFCCREKPNTSGQTVSRVSYVDLCKNNPLKIIDMSKTPVLDCGGLGTFDEFGVYPFAPVRHNNQIFGYYGGITRCESVPFDAAIGLAISNNDGKSFERIGQGPILARSLDEPTVIASPKVRIFNNKWYMFYSAGCEWVKNENKPEIHYKLRMAMSDDGINWTKLSKNILPEKIGNTEAQACGDVIFKNGKYHMFFCYRANIDFRRNRNQSYKIGYATSTDLINWQRNDKKAGIHASDAPDDFDYEMVAYPHLFELNNEIYMLYLGNEVGKYGFGIAKLEGELT